MTVEDRIRLRKRLVHWQHTHATAPSQAELMSLLSDYEWMLEELERSARVRHPMRSSIDRLQLA